MDENRVTGEVRRQAGKVQGAVGDLTGDASTQASGRSNEAQGTAENLYGQARDVVRDVADNASELWDDAYDQGRQLYRSGSRAVGSVDMTGVLIGLAAGYALALAIHGRRDSWGSSLGRSFGSWGSWGHEDDDEPETYTRRGAHDYRSGSGRGYR